MTRFIPGSKALKTETSGREIPGIMPHIFLWTHSGIQKKASVGLSKINPQEADMCCALAC